MDPKVCGKLLTHHQKRNKVDVEALRGWSPLRKSTRKGLQMGSHKNRGLRRWKKYLGGSLLVSWFKRIFRGRTRSNGGTRDWQATWAHPCVEWPTTSPSRLPPKLPGSLMSRKKSSKSFVAFGLRLVLISWKTKNRKKQQLHLALS